MGRLDQRLLAFAPTRAGDRATHTITIGECGLGAGSGVLPGLLIGHAGLTVGIGGFAGPTWQLDCASWWLHATTSAASHRQPRTRRCRRCQQLGLQMTDPDPDALDRDDHLAERRHTPGDDGGLGGLLAGEDVSREGLEVALESAQNPLHRLGWSRSPVALVVGGLIISLVLVLVLTLLQFFLPPVTAVALGIVVVVVLGAGGLMARGVGELRDSPHWKASGCFLCATAYLGTATVALVNGLPLIFQ